ncbi:MAG: HD-GYP domain-containing protein [Clostridiales bacterium]|nr:HD-GYP domain-containing protein [Clostridiales bacterium]
MRYVPISCVREGMITGRRLFGKNGELLLNSGTPLRANYITKLIDLGYGGLYIDDDLSRDIEIVEVINEDLRFKAVKTIKDTFAGIEKNPASIDTHIGSIGDIVANIVDDVLDSRDTMINMLDLKTFDDYTFLHSTNVAVLSLVMGVTMNMNKIELQRLGLSSILHDIGKVFIPKGILNKPEKLTEDEFTIIQSHSSRGYEYLRSNYDFPTSSYLGILQHHEKYDGSGYPVKLEGQSIHLYGRIISITDVYDALTSNRPYRKAMLPSEAIEYIMANGGNHFDPSIVEFFTRRIAPYPVGLTVKLSNNTSGIIMENFSNYGMRPRIRIFRHGGVPVTPYVINLRDDSNTRNITIIGMDDDIAV